MKSASLTDRQTFYCFRVLRLSRSRVIAGVCWAMAILRFALNINIAVRGLQYPRWDIVQTHALRWELATLQCVGSASDVLIAGTIATGLSRLRSGTSRDKLVDKLVAFAVGAPSALAVLLQTHTCRRVLRLRPLYEPGRYMRGCDGAPRAV